MKFNEGKVKESQEFGKKKYMNKCNGRRRTSEYLALLENEKKIDRTNFKNKRRTNKTVSKKYLVQSYKN